MDNIELSEELNYILCAEFGLENHREIEDRMLAGIKPKAYQPKTGAKCACKRGQERDNCPICEGTGQVIDFKAIRGRG